MPITQNETEKVVDIVLEYIEPQTALLLMNELVREIALETDNKSLRTTLIMLLDYVKFRLTNEPQPNS